jgi:hypothetical protein
VGDITGKGSLGRRELNLWPKVSVSEPLEKSGSAPFGDTSYPVDDEVLNEAALVVAARLERQGDPRVVADVVDLTALCQCPVTTSSPSRPTQTIDTWGLPSRPKVTRCASAEDSSIVRTLLGIVLISKDTGIENREPRQRD